PGGRPAPRAARGHPVRPCPVLADAAGGHGPRPARDPGRPARIRGLDAAALPGRCLAAGSIAGVAPYTADGLDWLDGMGPENVAEFGAALRDEAALTEFLGREAAMMSSITGESVASSLGGLVIEADRAVLTGEFADHVAACLRTALSSGIAGWRDDDLAFVKDWGFSLGWESPASVPADPAPVAVWQGDQDQMVPFAHGQWLAGAIRGARVHLTPGEGHLSMTVRAFDRILDDLLDLAGRGA
ncbi:MAG TPA: hypothetical protein VFW50_33560, partial [Streptosporangiaceae bacterium]|nr:hypothetical protein [Streptosporangiaceae bacterium]